MEKSEITKPKTSARNDAIPHTAAVKNVPLANDEPALEKTITDISISNNSKKLPM